MTAAARRAPTLDQLAGRACWRCGLPGGTLVPAGIYELPARSGSSIAATYSVKAHPGCPKVTR